jgi:isopropylmalate/homocitrate/citramalate synthase
MSAINEKELLKLKPWYRPGKWYATPATWLPEVRATMPHLPKEVQIQDTTLREGEENVSVSFTIDQKVEIAGRLSDMGVLSIDCGHVGNPYQEETVGRIISAGVVKKPTTILLDRICGEMSKPLDEMKKGADRTVEVGGTAFCPVCDFPGRTSQEQAPFVEGIKYIKNNYPDLHLSFGFTRVSGGIGWLNKMENMHSFYDWQVKLAKAVTEAGVDRVVLADSMGCASPPAWKYIVGRFREAIGPEKGLVTHNHNDYGQAVANALAGVEGGASWIDVTVCGLGDRAGNTSFEEVVLALEALYGIRTGIKLEKIYDLAKYVQEAGGVKVQPWKAVVGDRVWAESSHSAALVRIKRARKDFFEEGWEAWNPSIIGQTHQMLFGKVVMNPEVIEGFMEHLGLQYDRETVDKIVRWGLEEIDRRAAHGRDRWLSEEEVNDLCRKMAKKDR